MRTRIGRWLRPGLAVLGAALIAATAVGAEQEALEVKMVNNLYDPAEFKVAAGTTVRFVNLDADIHTVSDRGGGFESGLMFQRDIWTYTFNTPGTFEFFCLPHPFMVGKVTVE